MKAKYVVKKKTRTNNAFDAYKNIALNEPDAEPSAPPPPRPSDKKGDAPKINLPYQREALAIADIYQAESSNEAEGENILRVELTNGTYRDFVVKNGPKGDPGMTGLGGIRGPRGAQGSQGPKGEKGDKGDRGEPGPQGPMAKEKWITIADITTTEEVNKIEFTTDTNGNPFECKKIHAHGKLPSAFGSTQGFVYAVNGNNNGIFTSIFGDAIFFEIVIELFANGAVKYDLSQSAGEMQYIGNGGASWRIRTDGESIDAITQYAVECYTGLPIPIGTRIKIWGLKA